MRADEHIPPHRFSAYKHHSDHQESWKCTIDGCQTAWKLKKFLLDGTGFKSDGIEEAANKLVKSFLPEIPQEDHNITKNPFVTDLTEVLALRLLNNQCPGYIFPYPRVFHKERRRLQHHGIDLLGYEETPDGYVLIIVEVMASVQRTVTPKTVDDHYKQILEQTLNSDPPERLLDDIIYILEECSNEKDKNILNSFIHAVLNGTFKTDDNKIAIPILVRPDGMLNLPKDWEPFFTNHHAFKEASMPARLWFMAIECDCLFSKLISKIRKSILPEAG